MMAVRNRKEEFLSKAKKPKYTSIRFGKSSIDENGEFILRFLDKVGVINTNLMILDEKISSVKSLQSSMLEFSDTDAGLYDLYDFIKKVVIELVKQIRDLESWSYIEKFSGSETEHRIYNTQLMTSKKRIAGFITSYYSIQEEYKNKCKARVKRQALIAGADISRINFEEAMGSKTEVFMRSVFPDFDMTHHYLNEIKKRHENFYNLEKSIAELHELFFDFALVIQVDFALMDRIDRHSTYVDKLVIDGLKGVRVYKTGRRRGKLKRYLAVGCFIFVVGVVALLLIMQLK